MGVCAFCVTLCHGAALAQHCHSLLCTASQYGEVCHTVPSIPYTLTPDFVPRYSTLAGFLELGETLEQALCREVYEESGVEADLHSVR